MNFCNQWSNYVQYSQTGLTIAHTAQSPTTNTKATTVHIKDWWVHPMKLRKVSEPKSLCRITNPLLTASMNTKYLRLRQLRALLCPGYAYSTLMGNVKYTATSWTSCDKLHSVYALYQPKILREIAKYWCLIPIQLLSLKLLSITALCQAKCLGWNC